MIIFVPNYIVRLTHQYIKLFLNCFVKLLNISYFGSSEDNILEYRTEYRELNN